MPRVRDLNLTMSRDTRGVIQAKVDYALFFSETEIQGDVRFVEKVVLARRYGDVDTYKAGPPGTAFVASRTPSDSSDRVVSTLADETVSPSLVGAHVGAPLVARSFSHVLSNSELGVLLEVGRDHPYAVVAVSPIEILADVQSALVEIDVGDPTPSPAFEVGGEPVALAVDGTWLWVVTKEGTLRKFDRLGGLLASVDVDGQPTALALVGDRVWVPIADGTIKLFLRDGTLERAMPSGSVGRPVSIGVALSAVWVGHHEGDLALFDREGAPLGPPHRAGLFPLAIAGDANDLAVVACFLAGTVEVHSRGFGLTAYAKHTVSKGSGPWDVALYDDVAWVTNHNGSSVSLLDVHRGSLKSLDVGSYPKGIAAGAGSLWIVSFGSNELFRVDARDHSILATYAVGAEPDRVVFSGDRVFVANRGSRSISVVEVAVT